jgi:hypothetical protein
VRIAGQIIFSFRISKPTPVYPLTVIVEVQQNKTHLIFSLGTTIENTKVMYLGTLSLPRLHLKKRKYFKRT